MSRPTVALLGTKEPNSLESSYDRAFRSLGWEVLRFDPDDADRFVRGGRLGGRIHDLVPIEPWSHKNNRRILVDLLERGTPDLCLVFCNTRVTSGFLASLAAKNVRLALIWPDAVLNFKPETVAGLPLYDAVFTYSKQTVGAFERLGSRRVVWLPLAADPTLHKAEAPSSAYACDVSFIGGWRPEREAVLAALTGFDLKVWGPEWDRRCGDNKALMKAWQGRPLRGKDFASAIASSKISLNVIDPTNLAAANMRFFEIPISGGFQMCSPCIELDQTFIDGKALAYYQDPKELVAKIRHYLANEAERTQISRFGSQLVADGHTYAHRVAALLKELGAS